jgi:hypothetical protein
MHHSNAARMLVRVPARPCRGIACGVRLSSSAGGPGRAVALHERDVSGEKLPQLLLNR